MRAAVLTAGLFFLGGGREGMGEHDPGPRLVGETVVVSYVADPVVGHGRFRLENPGGTPVTAAVDAAWLERAGQRQPLERVTVFDLRRERMVAPESLEVDPGGALEFLLGFPSVAYEPRFGESSAVVLRVRVNGAVLDARSPLRFERRIPRGG